MLAVVIPRPGSFELRDVPCPTAGPGQALVRVMATTICATDQKVLAGQFAGVTYPHTPGHEFAGEVAAVGPDVDEYAPGDRVGVEVHVGCGRCARCLEGLYQLCQNYGRTDKGHAHIGFTVPGGLAEYAVVPLKALHRLPDSLSWDEGAFTDNIGIALYAVERGGLQPGESVAVIGPGAFGALAVQVARAMGAGRIALLGTRSERLERMRGMGADVLVAATGASSEFRVSSFELADHSERLVVAEGPDDAVAKTREALGGGGADVVIEFAGTAEAARQAILIARRGGRVVLAGSTGLGKELSGVDLSAIVRGHLDIRGSLANPKGISGRGLALIARGGVNVKPLMTHSFRLDQFPEAWDTFVERRGGAIRVMLHPHG